MDQHLAKKKKRLPLPAFSPEKKRIFQFISLAVLMLVLIFIGIWRAAVEPANEARFDKAVDTLLKERQQTLINFKSSITQQLASYAQQEQTQFLLRDFSNQLLEKRGNELFELQQRILNSIPHAKRVQIYLPRQAQREKDSGGSIGFVELDMINRAEKNQTTYPEVAKEKDSAEWEIHWTVPIYQKIDGQLASDKLPIGVLYTSTTLQGLVDSLSVYDSQLAKIELSQQIGRQRILRFFTTGNSSNNYGAYSTEAPLSHWKIEAWPSKQLYQQVAYVPFWLFALMAAISALTIYGAYYLAQRKNKQMAALYQALDIKTPQVKPTITSKTEEDNSSQTLSDPLYLSDQQLVIDEADQALIDGSYQEKQHSSDAVASPPRASATAKRSSHIDGIAVTPHIFRAYDIRGLVNTELTDEVANAVGKALATEALEQGENSLLVGYDARSHSPQLCRHLIDGILSTGCDVIDVGLVPTPLLNFAAIFSDQTSSGIIVTASHNPKEYNGFKMIINGRTLVDRDIQQLQNRITQGVLTLSTQGEVSEQDFSEEYIDAILADIAINSDLHIVIDASNGAASKLAPRLFEELGCQVTPLFCEFDGNFPNHDPDPSIEANLSALIDQVTTSRADLGLALDGDGDRLVIVTPSGRIIWPDQLLMLFARDVVSRNPGCDVIFDIKSTRQLNQVISSYGGRPVMWKTGHSHIKAKLEETGALLAGEFSGHIFFKERWFGFDDGIYAAARLLEMMSLRDQNLDDMLASLPMMVATSEIKLPIAEENKMPLIAALVEKGDFAGGEKTTIDGLRVDFDKCWGLVRASNTSSALTLRFEAQTKSGVEQLKTLFKRELKKVDKSLPLDF